MGTPSRAMEAAKGAGEMELLRRGGLRLAKTSRLSVGERRSYKARCGNAPIGILFGVFLT